MQQLLDNYNSHKDKETATEILNQLEKGIIFNDKVKVDLSNIPDSILDDCKYLSEKGFVIGGSIMLKIFGMINRDINDFDLFLSDELNYHDVIKKYEYRLPPRKLSFIEELFPLSNCSKDDDYEDNESKFECKIENLKNSDKKIDIFSDKLGYFVTNGIKIQSNPFGALRAKLKYYRDKDINDFVFIFNKII